MADFVDEADATAAVDGYTSSWIGKDIARKATFLTDDFILWNNCYKVELGRAPSVTFFNWLTTMMWDNVYYDVRRRFTPDGVIQQHLTSFKTTQGEFKDIPMLLVFETRGRQVARCEEYLDSTGLPALEFPAGSKFF